MGSNRRWKRREQRWARYVLHYADHRGALIRRLAGWNPVLKKGQRGDAVRREMRAMFRRLGYK